MSDYASLIALKPIMSIHTQRKTALIKLDSKLQMLNALDTIKPSLRIFSRVECDLNEALQNLEKTNSSFITALLKTSPETKDGEAFIEDQKIVRNAQFKCLIPNGEYHFHRLFFLSIF